MTIIYYVLIYINHYIGSDVIHLSNFDTIAVFLRLSMVKRYKVIPMYFFKYLPNINILFLLL